MKLIERGMDEKVEEGEVDPTQAEVGKGIARAIGSALEHEPVEGVGTMASWNGGQFQSLRVLDGATKFQVSAIVSNDEAENLEAAKRLAAAVMPACR